jgi:hypothetical protein
VEKRNSAYERYMKPTVGARCLTGIQLHGELFEQRFSLPLNSGQGRPIWNRSPTGRVGKPRFKHRRYARSNPPGNGRSSVSRAPTELPFLNLALCRLSLGNWTWLLVLLVTCRVMSAEPVAVRHREGTLHGFLLVRTLEGTAIATGDLIQVPHGDRVNSRIVFRFKDGSIDDETTVYSQNGVFRLISDHHVQRGASFPNPIDMSIETSTGQVTVHFTDNDGKDRVTNDHFDFPADLANGLVPILLKNIRWETPETKVSFLAAGPKPLLVKLAISSGGEERFSLGGSDRRAMHYVVKVEIGGVLGLLAPVVGKQPPEIHVWILGGEAPTFLKWRGPAYESGPIWITELTSPIWSKEPHSGR